MVESTLVAPGATVENFGPQAESIVVWFEVLDTTRTSVYSSSRSVTLLPDSAVAVVFDDWQAAPADSYIACAYTVLVNDTNPANDRLETGFLVEPRVPWSRLSDVPMLPSNKTVFYGGALANDGGLVYALKGNATKDFYGYDPAADTWAILDTLPGADKVGTGGALACLGQKLYALKGNPTRRFCGYDLNDNTWTQLADLPGSEPYPLGGALVGAAGKVFALKNSSQEFHAYDADSNTWTRKADIPLGPENKKAGYGTALTWDGATTVYAFKGNQTRGFYAYDPEQDVWARLPEIPAGPENKNVAEGGALAYLEPGYVFGFKGGGTNYYYCYDIEDSSWQACETIPKGPENRTVGWGGALSCLDGLVYALKGYSSLGFWVYTPNPVRPGQPLGGGVMSQGATSSHAWLRVSSPALRNLVLSYGLPVPGPVFIRLYDVSGRCVKQVCEPARPLPDVHACCLDARDLAAGVYVVHLTTGKEQMTRKVVLQK